MTEDKLEQLTVMHRSIERLKLVLDNGTPDDRARVATPSLIARHRAEVDADLRAQVHELTARFTEA
jgi:hypothetical protein